MNDADETRDILGAGYVADLEPLGDLFPLIRTHAESPYTPLEQPNRQEPTR